jgi:hypothetical protein
VPEDAEPFSLLELFLREAHPPRDELVLLDLGDGLVHAEELVILADDLGER